MNQVGIVDHGTGFMDNKQYAGNLVLSNVFQYLSQADLDA